MIEGIAREAALAGEPPYSALAMQRMPPWGLAAAARESLVHGNEHRTKRQVTKHALERLMRKFVNSADAEDAALVRAGLLTDFLARVMFEQFPFQESKFEEVARSVAWLLDGLPHVDTQVISEEVIAAALGGVPLRRAAGATMVLQASAYSNCGRFELHWLDQPNWEEVLRLYPRSDIETTLARLTTTKPAYRESYESQIRESFGERYAYNPLVATPFIDLGDGPIAPTPALILRTISPAGLYHAGRAMCGNSFAEDLGLLFEDYVGRQLGEIPGIELHPEIVYRRNGSEAKSVDWFVVFDDLVLLVEAKSRRVRAAGRAGGPALTAALEQTLDEGYRQITRSLAEMREGNPAFSHIPNDRQCLGIIVTAEPFYIGPYHLFESSQAGTGRERHDTAPVTVASARELEGWVTHGQDAGPLLTAEIEARADSGVVSFRDLSKKPDVQNRILEQAWNSLPWPSAGPSDTR